MLQFLKGNQENAIFRFYFILASKNINDGEHYKY